MVLMAVLVWAEVPLTSRRPACPPCLPRPASRPQPARGMCQAASVAILACWGEQVHRRPVFVGSCFHGPVP